MKVRKRTKSLRFYATFRFSIKIAFILPYSETIYIERKHQMILLKVAKNDAGQRFEKYLKRQLKTAQSSFLYKMLRKKNIVLNGKKATGRELLCENDEVKLFLSDETYKKFGGVSVGKEPSETAFDTSAYLTAYHKLKGIQTIFENEHVLILNKPAGILSQKAEPADFSANEWLIGYLLETGSLSLETLLTFKPSVCNRLDRNTSGLLVCGKTLFGSRYLSSIIKDKSLQKYYYTLTAGTAELDTRINGWLCKNAKTNKVTIYERESDIPEHLKESAGYIDTSFKSVKTISTQIGAITLLEVQLFTGKTHQIRAQLSAMGYPVIGDRKYGSSKRNKEFYDTGVRNQLLHAYKLVFPKNSEECFADLSERTLTCELPTLFERLMTNRPNGRNEVLT